MVPRVWRQAFIACMCAGGWQAGGAAQAQDASGKAVAVLQAADAVGPTGARILAIEQPVYMGDRIRTGSTGEAQIRFHDDTRLVVGPDSVFLIERYVLRGSTTVKDFTVDALRGSFRFMSGASPKSAYAIRTPTATIGIRGTQFDLAVGPGGETSFVLFDGRARVCDGNGRCLTATEPCSMLFVPSRGPVRRVSSLQETRSRLRADFPYVVGQSFRLRRDFQVNVSSCGDLTQTFP
ncbi:FecR domain-containing protein [Chelatococcus sp. SYSU_G07232]|uniref:FecR domain-containing protein n=1 Tax=Chelatococcus albus TaxID=3047466 RepID=A0ABT7AKQ5_9HYPH|nr:FecR domain-containing protein [Chelatococcus sp. SYSU_G07232]MDJ1159961.1 FecR domain-containing protein [Chelatococcus sp. SYSU_G07232]